MSTIIKTTVSDKAEQFTIGLEHYVGRRVLVDDDGCLCLIWFFDTILFRLDYDRGDIFVDPSLLRPFPDSKIEEPSK